MKTNTVYCGDSVELLSDPQNAESVDLVFADPPYNIGYAYDRYRDDRPDDEYVEWCRTWMGACRDALKPHGSFYLAIGDDFAADLRIVGRELGLHLRNWIIWHYTFGQNMKTKFSRAHTHILYFCKHPKNLTFNDRMLRFPSARHTEYQDLRASPRGRMPDDVWSEFPRVCGTFKERDGYHGCQLPEALLTRIILASSNPGDVVMDPFVGSGTTVVVAKRLGRKYIGIDLSETYVERTRERVENTPDESDAKPDGDDWPVLHVDMLMHLYRETNVALDNLVPNEIAMRVIAASLSERSGAAYDVDQVRSQLESFRGSTRLPKLVNDRSFVARNHVKDTGKKYVRRVSRIRKRRNGRAGVAPQATGALFGPGADGCVASGEAE